MQAHGCGFLSLRESFDTSTAAGTKVALEGELNQARNEAAQAQLMTKTQFARLLDRLKSQLNDLNPETKRRIIHALIQKIVITHEGFEMHYFAGLDRLRPGPENPDPSKSLAKKISVPGSFKDLNGGGSNRVSEPTGTREYAAQWARQGIDLKELAALLDRGWPIYKLARRFRKRRDAVLAALCQLGGAGA